jgi:hypothetical protein
MPEVGDRLRFCRFLSAKPSEPVIPRSAKGKSVASKRTGFDGGPSPNPISAVLEVVESELVRIKEGRGLSRFVAGENRDSAIP